MVNTSLNFHSKCRSCLAEDEEMHYLFTEFDQGLRLLDILRTTTCFEIEENDGLSPYLCENCTTIVVDFFNFKAVYLENNNYIKSLYEGNEKDTNEYEECMKETKDCRLKYAIASKNNSEITASTNDELNDVKLEITGEFVDLNGIIKQDILEPETNIHILDSTKYFCEECGDNFLLKLDFKQHLVKIHNISDLDLENNVSKAAIQVPNEAQLETNDENIILQCDTCGDKFNTYIEIQEHYKSHKKFVCEHCGAGFLKKSYLNDHAEIHTTEKRHVCPICGKAFRRRTVLVKHKKIHTHPRQCVCEICGLRFTDKGTLKTHIKLKHTKERNFNCTICGLWFPLKSTLMKHIYRHNEGRKREYVCTICHMSYKDKSSLTRHVVVKHTENATKPSCTFCGKQYTTNTNLLKHVRRHHEAYIKNEVNDIEDINTC